MVEMDTRASGRGNEAASVSVKRACSVVAATAFALTAASVPAATYTWKTANTTGDWNAAANWTPSGGGTTYPGSGDSAVINNTTATTVSLNGAQEAASLSVTNYSYSGVLKIMPTGSGNSLTLSGATAITKNNNGTVSIGDSTNAIPSSLVLASSTTFSNAGTMNIYSAITGSSSDLALDAGVSLTFSNTVANTFRNLTINSGNFTRSNTTSAVALCSGSVTIGDGVGAAASAVYSDGGGNSFANSSLLGKSLTINSDGQLTMPGGVMAIGTLNLAGGSIKGSTGRQFNVTTINVTDNSLFGIDTTTANCTIWRPQGVSTIDVAASKTLTFNAQISKDLNGDRTSIKTGAGTWLLANGTNASGSNKVSFTVRQGTLQVNANSLGTAGNNVLTDAATTVTLGDGSTPAATDAAFVVGGAYTVNNPMTVAAGGANSTRTIGGVNASGTAVFAGNITLGQAARLNAASGGKVQFTGVINDAAESFGLTTLGAGTVELTNANTYDGGTSITQGTLVVSNSSGSATGTGAVSIDGGTLSGSGVIQGTVHLNSGTLSPGNSPGKLTVGGVTLAGGTLAMDVNGTTEVSTHDQIMTAGTVTLGESTSLSLLSSGYTPGDADYIWLINNTGAGVTSGHFTGLMEGATLSLAGKTFAIHYNAQYGTTVMSGGNDVVLTTVIPEPGAAMAAGLTALCVLIPRHRRR